MSRQDRPDLGFRMSDFSSQPIPERREKRKSLISQVGRSLDMMGGFKNLFPQGDNQEEAVKMGVKKFED